MNPVEVDTWMAPVTHVGTVTGAEDEEDDDEDDASEGDDTRGFMPVRHNPVLMTLYGQMSNVAKSYQSAICMLFS